MVARFKAILPVMVGVLALGGCAYQPDSFSFVHTPYPGVMVSVNCLDVAIEHRKEQADVLSYEFGNRCDEPVMVDLAAAKIYGQTDEGAVVELAAFDPFREIRALRIDGRSVGREAIEYPSTSKLQSLCVDAASIAHAGQPHWVCFKNRN